jgi:hypothetical protein
MQKANKLEEVKVNILVAVFKFVLQYMDLVSVVVVQMVVLAVVDLLIAIAPRDVNASLITVT